MERKDFDMQRLESGLTLITQNIPWVNSIAICVAVKAGPRYESKESSGIAHFLEHMLFEGTKNYPTAKKLAEVIEVVGGRSSAWTDKEYVLYSVKLPKEHLEVGINYLSEVLFHSRLDQESIEREKGIILEEMKRKEDNTENESWDVFMEYVWGKNQSLGRSTLGSDETISKINEQIIKDYLNQFYYPANMTISIVGNLPQKQSITQLLSSFNSKTNKKSIEMKANKFTMPKKTTLRIHVNTAQSQIIMGTVTEIDYSHQDRFAIRLIGDILGGGVSSRLFQRLVYELGIAYNTSVWTWVFKDTGMFMLYGGVSPENVDIAINEITNQLYRLRVELISKQELEIAKAIDIANMYYSLETPDSIAWWYATSQASENRILTSDDIRMGIEKVTVEDIKRVANKYLTQDKFITLVRGQ